MGGFAFITFHITSAGTCSNDGLIVGTGLFRMKAMGRDEGEAQERRQLATTILALLAQRKQILTRTTHPRRPFTYHWVSPFFVLYTSLRLYKHGAQSSNNVVSVHHFDLVFVLYNFRVCLLDAWNRSCSWHSTEQGRSLLSSRFVSSFFL